MATLTVLGEGSKQEIHAVDHALVIGRGDRCDIVVPTKKASRSHCRVNPYPGGVLLEDLNSRNGTYVNGRRVTRQLLADGDEVDVCGTRLVFHDVPGPESFRLPASSIAGDVGGVSVIWDDALDGMTRIEAAAADMSGILELEPGPDSRGDAVERLRVVVSVANAIATFHDLHSLLEEILSQAFETFSQSERGVILLLHGPGETLDYLKPAAVRSRAGWSAESEIAISSKVVRDVLGRRLAVLSGDVSSDERYKNQQSVMDHDVRSLMCAPLICLNELLGLIYLDTTAVGRPYQRADLDLVNTLAASAAIAIKNARLLDQVKAETARRASLARYLSPDLVEKIVAGELTLDTTGEVRHGTVFFSDIIGFTALSERLPPTEVVARLNRHLKAMERVIFRHGGTLDKFAGDAIMAFWGVVTPRERSAHAATLASLQMQNAQFDLNAAGEDPIVMAIGLNTGDMVAGNIGSDQKIEFTVIGDSVNLAQRVEAMAGRYQVLASESTFAEVEDDVVAVRFPPVRVKNKRDAVTMYSIRACRTGEGEMVACLPARLDDAVAQVVSGRLDENGALELVVAAHAAPSDAPRLGLAVPELEVEPVAVRVRRTEDGTEPGALRVVVGVATPPPAWTALFQAGTVIESHRPLDALGRG